MYDVTKVNGGFIENFNQYLSTSVSRTRDCLGVNHKTFRNMLGMTLTRYTDVVLKKDEFSIQELQNLADTLDFDIDLLFKGKIDYVALAKQFRGDRTVFPERYADESQQFGRARTGTVIFSHLAAYHGESYAREYFRRFQLYPEAFAEPSAFVNPVIHFDLVGGMTKEGYSEEQIRSIGTMTFALSPPELHRKLAWLKAPKTLYSYVYEELLRTQFDRMFDYQLTGFTDTGCKTVVRPRQEAQDAFKRKIVDNRQSCLYRQGVASSFLANISPHFAEIHEESCVHHGDKLCAYEINWN